MPATVETLPSIHGVYLVRLQPACDDRGRFFETFRREWIPGCREMLQANRSESRAGVLRGLHFHRRQADYWYVWSGVIRAGLFDLRSNSPTANKSAMLELSSERNVGLYIPPGVAHGFLAVSDTVLNYLVDSYYDGKDEQGVRWNDPALGLDWGNSSPILSRRDQENPLLAEIPPELRL